MLKIPCHPTAWNDRKLLGFRCNRCAVFLAGLAFISGCAERPQASMDNQLTRIRDEFKSRVTVRNGGTSNSTPDDRSVAANNRENPQSAAGKAELAETPTPLSQLSEKTTLESVLRSAAENSPMVRAAAHRWQAATHKRAQAVSLPDPKLEASYFVRHVDDRWMLSLSQDIPYPGKLILGGRVADKEAQAAHIRYQAAIRNSLAEAKEMYFELYYIDRAQQITGEIKSLYERYAALAAGGKDVGKTKLPETFRAESQRAQLGYDLVLLKEMRATEAQRLRSAMGLSGNNELGPTQDIAMPVPLGESLERLNEIAERHNQELLAAGVDVERAGYQSKLARRAAIPDLMVGASYTNMADVKTNKDPISANVGVSIPLWFGKYRAMAKEAREMEEAMKSEQLATQLQVRSDLAKAYFSLKNSNRLVQLYNDTLVPQARQALQSAEEIYRMGDANLASLLELTATIHNFELARLRATADYYQNVARIERVLGTALTLTPAPSAKMEDKR